MAELTLAQDERLRLRAQAHRLQPVVQLGAAGLSEAVFAEIDRALRAHGLIKVRAAGTQRTDREALSRAIAERLGAAQVQLIGNTVVLFRPIPEPAAKGSASGPRRPRAQGQARPRAPADRRASPAKSALPPRRARGRGAP